MQAVFSMSQLQYFQLSTTVELYKKNQETQKFCPLAQIFHLAPYLIFIAVLKSTYPERMVLVAQYKQYFHVSAPLYLPSRKVVNHKRQKPVSQTSRHVSTNMTERQLPSFFSRTKYLSGAF